MLKKTPVKRAKIFVLLNFKTRGAEVVPLTDRPGNLASAYPLVRHLVFEQQSPPLHFSICCTLINKCSLNCAEMSSGSDFM